MTIKWPRRQSAEPQVSLAEAAKVAAEAAVHALNAERVLLNKPEPLIPDVQPGRKNFPYRLDYPMSFWITYTPKKLPGKAFSVEQLRMWADNWDPLRSVIEYIKGEVASIPGRVVGIDGKPAADADEIKAWLEDDGPLGGFGKTRREFEGELIEDMLVVGQYCVWFERALGGQILSCDGIDAGTIKPAVDAHGWARQDYSFEQWVLGVCTGQFTIDEMRVGGLVGRTFSPYYVSPIEWAIRLVFNGGKLDEWNTDWLSGANIRTGDVITLGPDMTVDEIIAFRTDYDAFSKSAAMRQSTMFLPNGSEKLSDFSRKDQDFGEFEIQTIRRLCALFGIQPASIGYVGEQYKVTQGDAMKASRRVGVGRVLRVRAEFYNDLFRRLGRPDLRFIDADDDLDEQIKQTGKKVQECGGAYKTVNEVRGDEGYKPIEGGDALPQIHAMAMAEKAATRPDKKPGDDPDE